MGLAHGLLLLLLGLLVTAGVFYCITLAETEKTDRKPSTALDDFHTRQDS